LIFKLKNKKTFEKKKLEKFGKQKLKKIADRITHSTKKYKNFFLT